MSPANTLLALVEAGVVLWFDGDALRYRSPAGVLEGPLRARVAASRGAIVALMRAGACLPAEEGAWPADDRGALRQRAGIMEFDQGLVREVAERGAERLVRLEHARAFVARVALFVRPDAAAVAGERPRGGPHR